ncbi:MAG: metallophosphoesterase family protein [Bacteroidota bacterium]|nr:metallophosphoesterase family protein [Bacteroidota bacterium]
MGLIAVGDIHGCSRTLKALLKALSLGEEDHLVFLGDYVDRGPDTRGVIQQLIALSEQVNCTFLRGNHEQAMLDWLSGQWGTYWLHYGGEETLQSYMQGGKMDLPATHLSFLQSTTLYLDTPEFFFVHAGLRPDRTVRENIRLAEAEVFLHYRGHLRAAVPLWEKCVVFGHTPHSVPILTDRMIGIDTGCVFPERPGLGRLTAVRLPEREVLAVANQESR